MLLVLLLSLPPPPVLLLLLVLHVAIFVVDASFVVVIDIDSVANEERARGERERKR